MATMSPNGSSILPSHPEANACSGTPHAGVAARRERVTLRSVRAMKEAGTPFACVSVYDATLAALFEQGGVPVMLVGDSAAQVVLGLPRTIDMPMDVLIALTAGVRRGAPHALIMADLPFLSYHMDTAQALHNAGRFMTEGMADIVKLEADASFVPVVQAMTRAGIPVCAHIGMHPQRAALRGGYMAAGKTAAEAHQIVRDAIALEQAGAALLLVEAVPDEVAARIVRETTVPVIGIGAGPSCHGQILVAHDMLGLTANVPGFVGVRSDLGAEVIRTAREWASRVERRDIGAKAYRMKDGERELFEQGQTRTSETAHLPNMEPTSR
ncbi:MAG: 3-methyl-2-oxobutanoate hydroxymethyltransferase [Phycisphaeraceae bacterium]|nr:3-methyl-2-oxobutanoate hydroxymethyltransferase [Phycisphaerales bacterium]MCB9861424.1 3-methyl-2-oxobutanoate hydroxymethyltransferase [Phycisphaeraceae bacterium]